MAEAKKPRYFLWAIMILLCVGLLGFGTGGFNSNVRSIGSVGEKDLTVNDYRAALNQQIRAVEAQIGTRIPFNDAQSLGIVAAAQSQLITRRALDNEATQLGLSVGDERVREDVLSVPGFRGLDGTFDREAYRSALSRNGLTEASYEDSIRENAARTLLQAAVLGGVTDPAAYTTALVSFFGEQRDFVWATLTADDLVDPIAEPTDSDVEAYYADNPDAFTAPEAREISYAWLTPDMIQDTVTVDEDVLRELYNARIAEFVRPERRLVERLAFVDTAAAEAAKSRLDDGELDFDALVAERGLDLADIDLGDVAKEDLPAAGDAVFAANSGDIVGPLNSSIGPALFRMNAVLAAEEITFEDATDQLRVEASSDRARRVIDGSVDLISDLLVGGATLENLAAETDMQFGQISMTPDQQDGIAAYEAFRAAAAAAEENDFPAVLNLADGGVFALRLDAVTPPTVRAFEDVKDQATTLLVEQREREAVLALAQDKSLEINPLTDFTSLGLTPVTETGLTRRSFVEGTPPTFMTELFATDLANTLVVELPNGAIVARVDAVNSPDLEDAASAAESEQIGNLARAGIAQDLFDAYSASVQIRTDVSLDQTVINAVHSHMQ